MDCDQYIGPGCGHISFGQSRSSMKLVYIPVIVLLVSCATNKGNDQVILPPGKLYVEPEVVYKDEHNTRGSCRIWH
jgi:hypothetical protein